MSRNTHLLFLPSQEPGDILWPVEGAQPLSQNLLGHNLKCCGCVFEGLWIQIEQSTTCRCPLRSAAPLLVPQLKVQKIYIFPFVPLAGKLIVCTKEYGSINYSYYYCFIYFVFPTLTSVVLRVQRLKFLQFIKSCELMETRWAAVFVPLVKLTEEIFNNNSLNV